jgi:hypothetical protein
VDTGGRILWTYLGWASVLVIAYFAGMVTLAVNPTWYSLPAVAALLFLTLRANNRLHKDSIRKLDEWINQP